MRKFRNRFMHGIGVYVIMEDFSINDSEILYVLSESIRNDLFGKFNISYAEIFFEKEKFLKIDNREISFLNMFAEIKIGRNPILVGISLYDLGKKVHIRNKIGTFGMSNIDFFRKELIDIRNDVVSCMERQVAMT